MNAEIFKKDGTIKQIFKNKVKQFPKTKRVYPCTWVNKRNLSSSFHEYTVILDHLKIEYTTGNDAPRGGQEGNYIEIKSTVKFNNFVKKYIQK